MLGELRTSNMEDDAYLKFTEDFVTKFNKLEADFSRCAMDNNFYRSFLSLAIYLTILAILVT